MARPSDDSWPSRSWPAAPRPQAPAGTTGLDAAEDMPEIIRGRSAARDRIGSSSRERLRAARLAAGWSPRADAAPGARAPAAPPEAPVTPSVPVTPVSGIDQVVRGPLFRPPEPAPPEEPSHEVIPARDDWFWHSGDRAPQGGWDPAPEDGEAPAPQAVADPFDFLPPAPAAAVEFQQPTDPDPLNFLQPRTSDAYQMPQPPGTDPFGLPMPAAIAPRSAAARHARGGSGRRGRRGWRMPAVTGAAGVLAGLVLGLTGGQHAAPVPAEAAVVPSTVTVTAPTVPPVTVTVTAAAASAPPSPVRYADCDAVTRAGAAPLYRGEPGYRAALDPDGDGIACEHG